ENADDQHNVADDLSNRVLQPAIETALGEKSVEQKSLGLRRKPKNGYQQADQEESLNQTEPDSRHRRGPRQRHTRSIDGVDREENERQATENRRNNCDEVRVYVEAAESAPNRTALQYSREEDANGKPNDEGNDA